MMRRLLLRGALAARCMCVVQQQPCVRALPLSVWLPCCLSYSTTPLLQQRDDKHNDMSLFAAPAHSTVSDVPAELYTKTMMSLQLDKSGPALENNLYDYVAHRLGDDVAAKVMRDCTVAQYMRQPATCCADAQARQRIDALADIQPARELLRMFNAGYATVGAWAKAGMPTNVAGVSAATYSYLTSMVDAARAQPQVTHPARYVVARDEYGQKEQLLSADVGRALYDSVYKATWGALQYTADGVHVKTSRAAEDVVLPIVPCGTWPDTLVMDDSNVAAARRASTAPDVLTLYSPLGWPATWDQATLPERAPSPDEVERRVTAASAAQQLALDSIDYDNTLFVRGEVQRVWRCIERTRDEAQPLRQGSATTQGTTTAAATDTMRAHGEQGDNAEEAPAQAAQGSAVPSQSSTSSNTVTTTNKNAFVIVRGTPGIGKTLSIGGYVLYKLLHEEGERALPYVLFEVEDLSFVFDKRNATVACYERASFSAGMFARAVRCQYARIFDCSKTRIYAKEETKKGAKLNIVITSPNTNNIHEVRTKDIDFALLSIDIVHAWSLREMLLVGRYLGVDEATVRDRVTKVGPLPRFVFDYYKEKFERRVSNIYYALHSNAVKRVDMPLCSRQVDALYNNDNPAIEMVFDLRRAADDPDDTTTQDETKTAAAASYSRRPVFSFYFIPLSLYAKEVVIQVMRERQRNNELYFGSVLAKCINDPNVFEGGVVQLFATQAMWAYIAGADNKGVRRCMYMPRSSDGAAADEPDTPLRRDTLRAWLAGMAEHNVACFDDGATITFDTRNGMRVFKPNNDKFPLVDAFVLLYYAERVHYIGIQVTDNDSHRPTADNVRSFYVRHPKIVVAGADGLTPQQPSLTRVTPPTVQVSTRVDSPAMQEASVDVLNKKVLGNVNGTRSMLYVKEYDGNNVSYQQLQSATDVPEDVAQNWHTYAQYCCRVRNRYW